jgi:UDP-N-acetyl-D-glucosamine dehydrogenase
MSALPESHFVREFLDALDEKRTKVGIVGLGYVGLPLVRAFINAGYTTMGFDVDTEKVDSLKNGRSYIQHVPDEWIRDWIDSEKFVPTDDMTRLAEPDAILICVPTPLTVSRDPDLTYVISTAETIAQNLRKGQLVVLESTTYPGTSRDVLQPIFDKTPFKLGEEYFLAYSPEREDPGNLDFSADLIPKVVGGAEPQSLLLAESLYRQAVVSTVSVSSCEVAEACKILENTYRSVNIAMVNELKVLFDRLGIDIWEVIDAAKTKPFGFQPFYPGPGLGGHCIPIDPFYLSWVARQHGMTTKFIELAGEINTSMPQYVVSRLTEALNDAGKSVRGSRIGILGVAYKRDVDDPRESPAFKLMELLGQWGAELSYNDPHIPILPVMRHYDLNGMTSSELSPTWLSDQDAILIATDHSAYDWNEIVRHAALIIDTRNATQHVKNHREKIVKA